MLEYYNIMKNIYEIDEEINKDTKVETQNIHNLECITKCHNKNEIY